MSGKFNKIRPGTIVRQGLPRLALGPVFRALGVAFLATGCTLQAAPSGTVQGNSVDATELRNGIKQCWDVSGFSPETFKTIVTLGIQFTPAGLPAKVWLKHSSSSDPKATQQAYYAARMAVLNCAGDGYPLPPEKYEIWKHTEINFDPTKMKAE